MNPAILGVLGPGFLNQVPTRSLITTLIDPFKETLGFLHQPAFLEQGATCSVMRRAPTSRSAPTFVW